jgi:hypothetical protein
MGLDIDFPFGRQPLVEEIENQSFACGKRLAELFQLVNRWYQRRILPRPLNNFPMEIKTAEIFDHIFDTSIIFWFSGYLLILRIFKTHQLQ